MPHLFVSVHAPSLATSDDPLAMYSLICVWSSLDLKTPMRVLISEAEVTCAVILPTTVIAGTTAGSAILWDLREPSTMHRGAFSELAGISGDNAIRHATYCTDSLEDESHFLPVCRVSVMAEQIGAHTVGDGNCSLIICFFLIECRQIGISNSYTK